MKLSKRVLLAIVSENSHLPPHGHGDCVLQDMFDRLVSDMGVDLLKGWVEEKTVVGYDCNQFLIMADDFKFSS